MDLEKKTILITGAAKRVGRAIALKFALKKSNILLHYRHSKQEAVELSEELKKAGVSVSLFQADLAKTSDITRMISEIFQKGIHVDILVNSASIYYKTPKENAGEKDFDQFMNANLKAPYLLSLELGRDMIKNLGGKIINIADWSGFRPYKDFIPYCTSKGGLITLTKALARDFAPKVQVNAVAPGPVLPPPDMGDTEKQAIAETTALKKWGNPEDIASAVCFLAENDFINGTVLVVDGGRSIV